MDLKQEVLDFPRKHRLGFTFSEIDSLLKTFIVGMLLARSVVAKKNETFIIMNEINKIMLHL